MDISDTLAPDSDQLDAIDLATGPRIFTVKSVSKGDAEQPVQVHLVEFPRGPWRPGKNMRRVLAACWGVDASAWAGRRVELYCDPAVRFGADVVGGTRVSRLSHIDKQQKIPLLVSRGKSATFTVQPLPESAGLSASPPRPAADRIPTTDVVPDPAQTGTPSIPQGGLKDALTALSAHQRADLFAECSIPEKASMAVIRARLHEKWVELGLPQREAGFEPVPVTLLGAIYAKRAENGSAEAFQDFVDTGESLDAGDQATIDGEILA